MTNFYRVILFWFLSLILGIVSLEYDAFSVSVVKILLCINYRFTEVRVLIGGFD